MDKKIICINPDCKAQLKRPQTSFIKCPQCRTEFFVFCHEFPYKLFEHVQCKKCPNELYYFFCFNCTALMNFTKYRMGSVSTCKCGFQGCYVVCNKCKKTECFPPDRRYEGVAWKCSQCIQPFNFITCDQCFHEIYKPKFTAGQALTCKNRGCQAHLNIKNCKGCKFIFVDSRGRNRCEPCYQKFTRSKPQPSGDYFDALDQLTKANSVKEQRKKNPCSGMSRSNSVANVRQSQPLDQKLQCKVCLDNQASFINTKCFHLSVCEVCVKSMNNNCPICRAEGQFHKVFT